MLKRPRSVSPKLASEALKHPLPKRVRLEGDLLSAHSEPHTIDLPTVATRDKKTYISPDVQMWEALSTPMDPDTEISEMDVEVSEMFEEVDQLDEESEDGMEGQWPNKFSSKTEPTSASLPRTPLVSRSIPGKHNFTPTKPRRTRHKFIFRPLETFPTPTPVVTGTSNHSNTIVLSNELDSVESIATEFAGASPVSSSNPFLDLRIEKKGLGADETMTRIHKPSIKRRNRRNIRNQSGTDGDLDCRESESDADDSEDDIHDGSYSDGSNDGGSFTAVSKEERPASFSWSKEPTINTLCDDSQHHELQYCNEATNDSTQIATPNARGEHVEFVNMSDDLITPTTILVFGICERDTNVVYGLEGESGYTVASNHKEMAGPSALINDAYVDAVAMRQTPSTPGEELQIRDVVHASGEELMVSEDFSEKEEMEVIDSLTGKGLDEKTDAAMAQEGVEGLMNNSDGAMPPSQAQSSNLPLILPDPPDTTWVVNHRGEEVELAAHGVDNVDECGDSGLDEDMATSSQLSSSVALPCSAILSIPALVLPLEVNEAAIIFSQESQEGRNVLQSLQDGSPDRLPDKMTLSGQKWTTNNRGEELQLMKVDVDVDMNNEGVAFASAHDMAALVFPPVDDFTVVFDVSHAAGQELQANKGMGNEVTPSNTHEEIGVVYELQGGKSESMGSKHGEIVLGEERTMVYNSHLSEKEEMEVVDSLTGMALDEETDVPIAEEDVGGLIDDSEQPMNVSQTQPPNLLPVSLDPPNLTWVSNYAQEVEMEARDVDNISERDGHGSDQDMAAAFGLSLDVAFPRSAILSIPALVFLPEVNEAPVLFSQASQEVQSLLHSPQDDIPNRLAENTTVPWMHSSQKPTTNNRGEEVELMKVDANDEGDDKSAPADPADKARYNGRGDEMELMGACEQITNEEQFVVGGQPLNERGEEVEIVNPTQGILFTPMNTDTLQLDEQMVHKEHYVGLLPLNDRGEEVEIVPLSNGCTLGIPFTTEENEIVPLSNGCTLGIPFTTTTLSGEMETKSLAGVDDVPTHSLLSFDSEAIITWNRRCRETEIEAVDKSNRKTRGINPLVFLSGQDDHQLVLFERATKQHFPDGHGVKLANTATPSSKPIPKQGKFLSGYGRDSSDAPLHPATLVPNAPECRFDGGLFSDHNGGKKVKSSNLNHNVHPPPSMLKDFEDDIVMYDSNNSEDTNSSSPDKDECQTPPAPHRPPLVFLKDVDDDFIIDLPHGSDSEKSVESDEESDHSDVPLIFPNESDRDFILDHDESAEHINLDDLVGGSDDENSHQKVKQSNIFLDPLMEAHYYDLINCPSDTTATKHDIAFLALAVATRTTATQQSDARVSSVTPPAKVGAGKSCVPTPRAAERNLLAANIRAHAFRMMGRKKVPGRKVAPIENVSLAEVIRFYKTGKDKHGPTKHDFKLLLDTEGLPTDSFKKGFSTPWNERAADVFTKSFLKCKEYECLDEKLIKKQFLTHVIQLKDQYKRSVALTDAPSDSAICNKRRARRVGIHKRRTAICESFKLDDDAMRRFHKILTEEFDWRACSGDETDDQSGEHAITVLPWRAREVRSWGDTLDKLHLTSRFPNGIRATAGCFPHPRFDPQLTLNGEIKVETHMNAPVKGLPSNFYDPQWLTTLSRSQRSALDVQPHFDLNFAPQFNELAETAQFVKGPKTIPLPRNHDTSERPRQKKTVKRRAK